LTLSVKTKKFEQEGRKPQKAILTLPNIALRTLEWVPTESRDHGGQRMRAWRSK